VRSYAYRMNRASFGLLLAIMVAAYVVMVNVMKRPPGAEILVVFITVPRLHDVGLSGWWILLLFLGEFAAILIGATVGGSSGILIGGGIFVLVALLALIGLALIPGESGENRWGPPPAPGIRFGRPKSPAA